ncbi:MAG: hypothetical protein GY835_10155 [bacterium]|nr:hypothetical protein [bacterium]
MHIKRLFLLAALLACHPPGLLFADVVMEFDVRKERIQGFTQESRVTGFRRTVSIGAKAARMDDEVKSGEVSIYVVESYLLRPDLGKLFLLHHRAKAYRVVELPIELEAYIPEECQAVAPEIARLNTLDMELTETGDERTFGSWRARLWRADVVFPVSGTSEKYEFWVSTELDFDPGAYKEFMRNFYAIDYAERKWRDEILALEGVVIHAEARRGSGQATKRNSTIQLLSIGEKEVDPGYYEVPEGYREVPFRFDMAIVGPGRPPAKR